MFSHRIKVACTGDRAPGSPGETERDGGLTKRDRMVAPAGLVTSPTIVRTGGQMPARPAQRTRTGSETEGDTPIERRGRIGMREGGERIEGLPPACIRRERFRRGTGKSAGTPVATGAGSRGDKMRAEEGTIGGERRVLFAKMTGDSFAIMRGDSFAIIIGDNFAIMTGDQCAMMIEDNFGTMTEDNFGTMTEDNFGTMTEDSFETMTEGSFETMTEGAFAIMIEGVFVKTIGDVFAMMMWGVFAMMTDEISMAGSLQARAGHQVRGHAPVPPVMFPMRTPFPTAVTPRRTRCPPGRRDRGPTSLAPRKGTGGDLRVRITGDSPDLGRDIRGI